MEDALETIDRIIAEHIMLREGFTNLERVANDAEAMKGFEVAKEAFMPGRLDIKKGLREVESILETIENGMHRHFHFEEASLPPIVDRHGDDELKSSLRSILIEHVDLRGRLAHSRKHVDELASDKMARHRWEANAHDMRTYISHTKKLLEVHAGIEQKMLHELQRRLKK